MDATRGATAGSTLRRTVLEALHDKYAPVDDQDQFVCIYVPKSAPGKTDAGGLVVPQHLTLNGCNIDRVGDLSELTGLCQRVTELDLAQNDIGQWREVLELVSGLPKLTFLNVSQNPLSELGQLTTDFKDRLPAVRTLVANKCCVPWGCVDELLGLFKSLEEIHLSLNEYASVQIASVHANIACVTFNANLVKDWSEINKLGHAFPRLTSLTVTENAVDGFGPTDALVEAFPNLERLCVSNVSIGSWDEIRKLNRLPRLTDVRMTGVPLLQAYPQAERRKICMVYLPQVTRLNGSPIVENDRELAERAFIRSYLDKNDKPERYYELEAIHGCLKPLVDLDLGPQTHVSVTLHYEENVKLTKLDITQTVLVFKQRMAKLIRAKVSELRVYHEDVDVGDTWTTEIMPSYQNGRFIHALHCIRDGDKLFVETNTGPKISSRPGCKPICIAGWRRALKTNETSKRD